MRSIVTDRVAWSVGLSVTLVSPVKWVNWSRCRLGWGLACDWDQRTIYLMGIHILQGEGAIWGKGATLCKVDALICHEPCKNGWTDRDAVLVVDSGMPKEACVTWGYTFSQPGEYGWFVHVQMGWMKRRLCGLMSNISFDHFLIILSL